MLICDEVQEVPRALSSLKYFCEKFLVDTGEKIIPVEVKVEVNLRAKSLKVYQEKYKPEVSVRTSMADYKKEEWLMNLPLYAIEEIEKL